MVNSDHHAYAWNNTTILIGIVALRYQRTSAEPQVKPPPMASNSTRSPFFTRPSLTATASASGIDAADVLPCRSTVNTTFCGAI